MIDRKLKRLAQLTAVVVAGLTFYVIAQEAAPADLTVTTTADYGTYLVTPDGHSLYLYTKDSADASACVDACANNWIALPAGDDGIVTAGEGADQGLVGTLTRPDGAAQVTYNGHPLYTFKRDTAPGTTRGQKLGGEFFLVSPAGDAILDKLPEEKVELSEADFDELMTTGGALFAANCAVCHGDKGEGRIGPALANNTIVGNTDFIVERVLNGFIEHGMPPFKAALDDQKIASVITFVRNSFGNDYGAVTAEEVSTRR